MQVVEFRATRCRRAWGKRMLKAVEQRPWYVIGPDGGPLTIADLPPPGTKGAGTSGAKPSWLQPCAVV